MWVRGQTVRAMRYSGLDWGVVYGSGARIWSMLTGAITVILIATFFSPSVQGFHYTFLSLTAVQVFFELGLTQVVIQFAAHEWSALSFDTAGYVEGDPVALSRLASLARFVIKWFSLASLLLLFGLLAAGWFSFHDAKGQISWQLPWLTLCIVVSLDLATLPLWSVLEGCNQIKSVYGLRFVRAVVGSLVFWVLISLGAGLWSIALSNAISLAVVTGALWRQYGRFFESLLRIQPSETNVISWRHELLPMQWRIAVSWLSGYCYFSLFVPVLFKYQGPVVAGQMGMSWNVMSAMITVPGMLVQTKVPSFGMLIAKRQWAELDKLALRTGISSLFVMMLGAVSLFLLIWWLNVEHFSLARRFLPLLPLSLFLTATVMTQLTSPLGAYLRAHRREPLMWASVASGLAVGICVVVFGRYWGVLGMGWSYVVISTLSVPVVIKIFLHCRSAWHT